MDLGGGGLLTGRGRRGEHMGYFKEIWTKERIIARIEELHALGPDHEDYDEEEGLQLEEWFREIEQE